MRFPLLMAAGLALFSVPNLPAQESAARGPGISLPEIGTGGATIYSEAEISQVGRWLRDLVPDYPAELIPSAAEAFLTELRQRYPDQADRLLARDFPVKVHQSRLLRHASAVATGQPRAALREQIASRRLSLLAVPGQRAPGELLGKIRDASSFQHRRVLEGRLDDDELQALVERTLRPAAAPKPAAPATPKELTAAELVSEFGRRNQNGAAVAQLQAYAIEGRLSSPGETSDLLLFKMRPDRFRLVLRREGRTLSVLAGEGDQYWLHVPGQAPRRIPAQDMGERRHIGEFIDPLFNGEGCTFTRLPDGEEGGRKFYRLDVRRADNSGHVVRVDAENFQEIGRENQDRSIVRYGDHREVAGVTMAFREEVRDDKGGSTVLQLTRVTANPGLIADFFRPPPPGHPAYFDFEQLVARPAELSAVSRP